MKQFGHLVSPEVMEEILNHHESEQVARTIQNMAFILIQLRDDDIELLGERIERGVDHICQCAGMMDSIVGSMLVACKGFPQSSNGVDLAQWAEQAAKSYIEKFGDEGKCIYGCTLAYIGLWGNATRSNYGINFPSFSRCLHELDVLQYGQCAIIEL